MKTKEKKITRRNDNKCGVKFDYLLDLSQSMSRACDDYFVRNNIPIPRREGIHVSMEPSTHNPFGL